VDVLVRWSQYGGIGRTKQDHTDCDLEEVEALTDATYSIRSCNQRREGEADHHQTHRGAPARHHASSIRQLRHKQNSSGVVRSSWPAAVGLFHCPLCWSARGGGGDVRERTRKRKRNHVSFPRCCSWLMGEPP
jgi:hypothetical protein